jgi:hypothetical protein
MSNQTKNKREVCEQCGKVIVGTIKIITYRRKLGKKSINIVEFYDEKCFLEKNKARTYECCKKSGTCKK